jgi:hypothetical protein
VKSSVASAVLMLAAALSGAASAATYANPRFGYWIDYPADLVPGAEADNSDGREFHASFGSGRMAVWGAYKALKQSAADIAHEFEADCGGSRLSYRLTNRRFIAVSCLTPSGRIHYQKTIIRADVLASVAFDYPLTERRRWEPVVTKVAGSLRFGSWSP